jgi:hypothetical protein
MTVTYDSALDTLHAHLMSGQRVYYPQPHYFMQEQLGIQCCTVFKMKQLVQLEALSEMRKLEPKSSKSSNAIGLQPQADRLKQEVASRSWNKGERNLSQSIMFKWPYTPFEEWVEQEVNKFWMTAEWFQSTDGDELSDFAFIVSVHTPASDKVKFDAAYGEAFVLTKLIHH